MGWCLARRTHSRSAQNNWPWLAGFDDTGGAEPAFPLLGRARLPLVSELVFTKFGMFEYIAP